MRLLNRMMVYIILLVLLPVTVQAVDTEAEQAQAVGVSQLEQALPDAAREILGDVKISDMEEAEGLLSRIGQAALESIGRIFRRGLAGAAVILTIVLLCAVMRSAWNGGSSVLTLGAALAVGTAAAGDIRAFVGMGADTLNGLSDFSKILLPSLSAAAAASGAVTGASARYAATVLFLDVLITMASRVVMPLIYAYIAAIIANGALGSDGLASAANLLKWLCKTLLTLLVLAFVAYLGLTGIISGAADAVTVRVTKTAISTVFPVVGGIISDAAGTVVAGAGLLRNAVGVFGMLAIICVCLTPFLTLGTQYLLYKAVAGLASVLADKGLGGMIDGIGSAFGLVLALVGAGSMMLFFSIISCIKAVGGV